MAILRRVGIGLAALFVAVGIGWVLIGPEWRSLLVHQPYGRDVLFWNQAQRDAGFRIPREDAVHSGRGRQAAPDDQVTVVGRSRHVSAMPGRGALRDAPPVWRRPPAAIRRRGT